MSNMNKYDSNGMLVNKFDERTPVQQRLANQAAREAAFEVVADEVIASEPTPLSDSESFDEAYWAMPREQRAELGTKFESREAFEAAVSKTTKQANVGVSAAVTASGGVVRSEPDTEQALTARLAEIRETGLQGVDKALTAERDSLIAKLNEVSPAVSWQDAKNATPFSFDKKEGGP